MTAADTGAAGRGTLPVWLPAIITIGVALGAPAQAGASPASKRAQRLHREGMSEARRGDLDRALELLKEARELGESPKLLLDLGETAEKKPDDELALEAYRAYLAARPRARNRAEIEHRVRALEARLAAESEAARAREEDEARRLAAERAAREAAPAPPPLVEPSTDRAAPRWTRDTLGWTLAGSGIVLVGIGTGFYVHAQAQKDELPATPEHEREDLRNSIARDQKIGVTGLVVGGLLVGAGILRFVATERTSSRRELRVMVGPTSIGVLGHF
jgi:hypothetical protein